MTNWLDAGTLHGIRIGSRRVRVRESDLQRFIEAGGDVAAGSGTSAGRERVRHRPSITRRELGEALDEAAAAKAP